jgi:hypothetical protein
MLKKIVFLICCILIHSKVIATLTEHNMSYALFISGIEIGTETRVLQHQNGEYIYRANAYTQGLISIFQDYNIQATSHFVIDDRVLSKAFTSKEYKNNSLEKHIDISFAEDTVIDNLNQTTWNNNQCVDFLSIFLGLGYDFKHGRALQYCLANGKEIKQYLFKNQGEVVLQIMGENVTTTKLTTDNITAYIAQKYDYLPVLIEKKNFKYQLKSIN